MTIVSCSTAAARRVGRFQRGASWYCCRNSSIFFIVESVSNPVVPWPSSVCILYRSWMFHQANHSISADIRTTPTTTPVSDGMSQASLAAEPSLGTSGYWVPSRQTIGVSSSSTIPAASVQRPTSTAVARSLPLGLMKDLRLTVMPADSGSPFAAHDLNPLMPSKAGTRPSRMETMTCSASPEEPPAGVPSSMTDPREKASAQTAS
mmetsp:Transcript_2591/g.7339  ORF Transcript_2591/g.7339 Transcript_2591/m.7339 type:complete len:206 (-) Transcript_2591:1571-2188(-)